LNAGVLLTEVTSRCYIDVDRCVTNNRHYCRHGDASYHLATRRWRHAGSYVSTD